MIDGGMFVFTCDGCVKAFRGRSISLKLLAQSVKNIRELVTYAAHSFFGKTLIRGWVTLKANNSAPGSPILVL